LELSTISVDNSVGILVKPLACRGFARFSRELVNF